MKVFWKDLTHRPGGGWTGCAVPTCPHCGMGVLLWEEDDFHECEKGNSDE
jgi:hypothetical protein